MARVLARFIAVYGINNIGKTTQVEKLVAYLNGHGYRAERIKYPIYNSPTGQQINEVLRGGKDQSISEEEFQLLYVKNREEYEPTLIRKLEEGIIIVAEDYVGTGISWATAKGASYEWAKHVNSHLLREDLAILLHGDRFIAGRENVHIHEQNDTLIPRVRTQLLCQAEDFGYHIVNANQNVDAVFSGVLDCVRRYTNLRI